MKKSIVSILCGMLTLVGYAQNVSTRTSEFEVDFSDPKKLMYSTVPVVNWISPLQETNYSQEMKFKIQIEMYRGKISTGFIKMKPPPAGE